MGRPPSLDASVLQGMQVLVVDDDEDIRVLLRGFLMAKGWVVDEAATGDEALAMSHADYDLIVLDQRMPGLTGYETGVRLRRRGFGGPIIFYSAYVTPELERDLRRDVDSELHIVGKPDLDHLLNVIEGLSAA